MTDRNELERLLAEASGNGKWRMRFVMDGNILIRTEAGSFVASGLVKEDAALICFLHNNAHHYLSLMDEVERLREALADANEALADIRQKPYAPWPDPDPEDTIGSMIDNQAWVMMSHIASFIGHRDGQPDLMEEWQDDWAENYHALFKGWFSPHRAAAKYIADRLTIRRQAAVEGAA